MNFFGLGCNGCIQLECIDISILPLYSCIQNESQFPLLSYMILLEIPSVEEGTSKEKEGWKMAVVAAAAVVAIVEAAVQILSACTFVQGRKAAQLVMGSLSGMHKGRDCERYTPSKN